MSIRSVNTTDTLGTFRTTFNDLGTDVGDLTTLNTDIKSTIVGALNEVLANTSSFFLRDSSSSVQQIETGDILNVTGDTNISVSVSATDLLNVSLNSTISGLTSISSTTLTDGVATLTGGSITNLVNLTGSGTVNFTTDVKVNSISVATKPFAIAQAIALG
jgi:hypothetical protein